MIVDGAIGFTGGVCIEDGWMGDADLPERWRETHVRVRGRVVRQMQAIFAANWLQTTSRLLVGPDYFPAVPSAGNASMHCFLSGPHERPENARLAYLLAISAARKSIRLAHAYFIPDHHSIEVLLAARTCSHPLTSTHVRCSTFDVGRWARDVRASLHVQPIQMRRTESGITGVGSKDKRSLVIDQEDDGLGVTLSGRVPCAMNR